MNSEQYNQSLIEKFEEMYQHEKYGFFDVSEYVELIEYYLDTYNIPLVKKAIELAGEQHPKVESLKILKIEYFILIQDLDAAKKYVKSILESEIESIDLYINIGKIYSMEGKSDLAIKYYRKAIHLNPEEPFAYQLIGEEYYNLQNLKKALLFFQKNYELDPINVESLLFVIYSMRELELHKEGMEFCMNHTEKEPYSLEAWYEAGIFYNALRDVNRAMRCFSLAHAIMPSSVPVLTAYGNALLKQLKFQKAIGIFEELIEHKEATCDGYIGLATAYLQLDQYDNAKEYFQKGTEVFPEEDKIWFSFYNFHNLLGQYDKAANALKEAIQINRKNKPYWLAYLELLNPENKVAILETLEEIISLDFTDLKFIKQKIELMIEMELYVMVIENISKFEIEIDCPDFEYYLVVTCALNHELEDAVLFLNNAIERDSSLLYVFMKKYPEIFEIEELKKVIDSTKL